MNIPIQKGTYLIMLLIIHCKTHTKYEIATICLMVILICKSHIRSPFAPITSQFSEKNNIRIFLIFSPPPTANIKTAINLQKLLEYGITFQTTQPQPQHPFLTPYEGILQLEANIPPLTKFQQTKRTDKIHEQYEELLNTLKRTLKTEKL